MPSYFRGNAETTFKKLAVLKDCVAEQNLTGQPCELLCSELDALIVLAEKLVDAARRLRTEVREHISS